MPDTTPSLQSSAPNWLRAVLIGAGVIGIVVYAAILAPRIASYASSSDASGYFNNARLLAAGKFFATPRTLPGHAATEFGAMTFQPLGFQLHPQVGEMVPTYPIGLPLHLLVASWVFGWDRAAVAVNLVAALVSGGLMWALARRLGLQEIWAGTSVAMLWCCPLFLFSTLQPMSDLLSVPWTLAVLYSALQARDSGRWGIICGVAMGVSLLIRPTNALLVAPALVAIGFRWKHLFAVALGGLPGGAVFAYYNWRVYGSPFTTGYGDISLIFGSRFLPHNAAHFAHWIPTLLSPVIVLALLAPFIASLRQRGYVMLAAWFLALVGFYVLYYHSGETWWYLRFILPAFPVLILAALAVVAAGMRAVPPRLLVATFTVAVVLGFACSWEIQQTRRFEIMTLANGERNYPDAARWAKANIPANSAIFCMQVSGAFFFYSDFLLIRWEQIDAGKYDPLLTVLSEQRRPVYAALFDFETPAALEKVGGQWTKLTTIGQVTFWQRQP